MTTRLNTYQRLAYGAPVVPVSMLSAPALAVLPALYAEHAGISLAALGAVLFVTRMFDSLIDPAIGYLSDRTRTPIGARKPWLIAGALICMISGFFWFRPGEGTGIVYFAFWSAMVYLGWSMIETAHAAWIADLSTDYDERSALAGFRTGAYFLGYILFFVIPLLPVFETTAITPQSLAVIAWVSIGALFVTTALAVFVTPLGVVRTTEQPDFWKTLKALWPNKPLRLYLSAITILNVSSGMVGALYYFYMGTYLGIADKIAFVALGVGILSFGASIIWPYIMKRTGKHGAITVGAVGTAATLVAMAFIPPGPIAYPAMLVVFGLSSLTSTAFTVAMHAIMADIVDYDELKTRQNSAALFYSFNTVVVKFGISIGAALSLMLVGLFGFDPRAETNTPIAMIAFFAVFICIPIVLNLSAALIAWRFPITRTHHRTIRKKLALRAQREARLV